MDKSTCKECGVTLNSLEDCHHEEPMCFACYYEEHYAIETHPLTGLPLA